MTTDKNAVLDFFSGKSRANAAHALKMIEKSIEQGGWIKGVSRSARAALNKSNEAKRFVEEIGDSRGGFGYDDSDRRVGGDRGNTFWWMCHVMRFGEFERLDGIDTKVLDGEARAAKLVPYFTAYRDAFAPVVAAMNKLDATRPPPVFTSIGASPTVTATVESFDAKKVEICPMRYEVIERVNAKTGKIEFVTVAHLEWPAGTVHGTSRYNRGCTNQCEACGHGIRNPFNWVPLVLTDKAGTPKSLIVGKDCAETLFGVKLTGELEIKGGYGSPLDAK